MPSNLPSSFASAAAGQNANRDARSGRHDGRGVGSGEWARRDGRANGTLTFRRSSTTPGQPSQPAASSENAFPATPLDSGAAPPTPGAATYDYSAPSQYMKESIIGLFKNGAAETDASNVYESGWIPGQTNGGATRGWGKSNNNHNSQDPAACWNPRGDSHPVGVSGLSEEEKEAYASDVNSPLKPPLQSKEGAQGPGPNGRKASLSHGSAAQYGLASPSSASRPGTRRRETTDSNPFSSGALASPSAARFARDDPAFLFGRKNNDVKEQEPGEEEGAGQSQNQAQNKTPFGTLTRSNTTGNSSMGANISSLWGAAPQPPPSAGGGGGGGMGSFGQFALPTPTSTIGAGSRGGSRFANLLPKDGADNAAAKTNEASTPEANRSWRSRPRTDTDPFGGDDGLSGSAALGGAQDTSPPAIPNPSNIGMFETPVKGSTGDFGMSGLNLGRQPEHEQGPASPSETNPYRSPPAERGESHEDTGAENLHGAAIGSEQNPGFNTMSSRGFPTHAFDGSDRSQTSSAGPRGYASGWPVPLSTGTPDRERSGFGGVFGNSLFSPMGTELQSPGLSSIGAGVFGPASAGGLGGAGTIGRSKLGSLFPPAMQAQMQGHEQENLSDSLPDLRQSNPLGAIGRSNFNAAPRDTGSPLRTGRGGVFEEMFPSDPARSHSVFGGSDPSHAGAAGVGHPQAFTPGVSAGADFGSAAVRQMVMPDRMRWVYLDPQGQVQGPFSGLEMNDWYKANFFTPDLRVKKVEDPDFEPLGQLIRRIGNSREPFLVPQIGIAHGPPSQAGPFSPSGNTGVIPPLSGVFPSFGRTLTAEEQNNLERRKQEEQQAMAQQRDFMMRQQAITRIQNQGPGGVPGSLHHQHSAHSLQSQPSFGSISSPIGAHPQQPPIGGPAGPTSGFFDAAVQQGSAQPPVGSGLEHFREEDLATLNASERQMLASVQAPASLAGIFNPPVGASANDTSLRTNLPGTEQLDEDDEGFRERLKEFEDIRAERDLEQPQEPATKATEEEVAQEAPAAVAPHAPVKEQPRSPAPGIKEIMEEEQQLSLTQQVQKAQAAAAAAKNAAAGLPMPFPPPLPMTGTPLPAPTAQRARSNLPEQYNRSQTGTPDTASATEPPPLAPWAKEAASRKGPSLKEIQEAEARKAAKAEELATERRRLALEQEAAALREREKAIASATGLPTTSTWGNGSPVAPASPWTKPVAAKPATGASTPSKQKTLADIQREEEVRKLKAKEVAVQTGLATAAAGKRYADLATKPNQAPGLAQANTPVPPPGSGWATVGAGGKVKVPTGPAAQTRSPSTTGVKPVPVVAKPAAKPVAAVAATAAAVVSAPPAKSDVAMDEFNKWLHRELSRGITGVDIDTFAATLLILPLDNTLIADAVYANSKTMNGMHFAEEFIRRKKLADKGVVEKQGTVVENKSGSSSSGWNEVAKKGGHKEQSPAGDAGIQGAGFKVVPTRKKAGKKSN
ncbi:hypothetical protein EsH8_VIII_000120 [Colletotrichum jinshuiense]